MNKHLLLSTALLLSLTFLHAQDLSKYVGSEAGSVTFGSPFTDNGTKTEVPPWIIMGGWHTYFFSDGGDSWAGSAPQSMITSSSITPQYLTTVTSHDGCTAANMFPWRRNYYSVYSAQTFNHPAQGMISLATVDGEDHSMVGTNQPPASCNSSDWPMHGSFVCAAWLPNTAATNWGQQYFTDLGPIVWPSMGYFLPNGQKCSLGCGNSSSIIADNYIYVFYKDESHYVVPSYVYQVGFSFYTYPGDPDYPEEEGRHGGIKVARAPLADALNSQAYTSFYEDPSHNQFWNPSVPAGFTKEMTTTYLWGVKGPMATNVMGEEGHKTPERFAVAKALGTTYYLGVFNYEDEDDRWTDNNGSHATLKIGLRYSTDLVHWSGDRVIYSTHDWTTTHFQYPIFLSSDGMSNNAIDPADFYIVGTSPSTITHTVYRMHLTIPPPPPPPPPTPTCQDANGNIIDCPADYLTSCSLNGLGNYVCAPGGTVPCDDGHGHIVDCTTRMKRKQAEELAAAILDMGDGRAPYVYPNPGHGVYTLHYTLKDHTITQLNVLDIAGRKMQTGTTTMRAPGHYTETVNITGRAKGMYLLELLVNGAKKTFKVVYE